MAFVLFLVSLLSYSFLEVFSKTFMPPLASGTDGHDPVSDGLRLLSANVEEYMHRDFQDPSRYSSDARLKIRKRIQDVILDDSIGGAAPDVLCLQEGLKSMPLLEDPQKHGYEKVEHVYFDDLVHGNQGTVELYVKTTKLVEFLPVVETQTRRNFGKTNPTSST